MSGAVQIGAIGVTAALCALLLKKYTPELAFSLALAAGCVLLSLALGWMEELTALLSELGDRAGLAPELLAPVLKVTGIALVSRWAAALCRDAGQNGLAAFVETAASALALLVCVPLLEAVLEAITELL